jgi:anti-sigma factor RsiW
MVGRVLSFGRSPHQNVQELLPWFLNGTLQGEEAATVEEHLRGCPGCREELECLRVMQSEYLESEMAPEAQAAAALAKLRPRMDEALPAKQPPRRATGRAATLTAPFPVWFKLAMAAQFALVFGLGWAVLQPDRAGLAYHTLSAGGAPERAIGSLVVVFDPAAPQRDVARILRVSGGRVVDGPTASNGYVVAVPDGGLSAALTRLRAEPAVVLAEPLQLERTR